MINFGHGVSRLIVQVINCVEIEVLAMMIVAHHCLGIFASINA